MLSFCPAMLVGHMPMAFFMGMPSAEVGPVSGRLMPMVTSARATPDTSRAMAAVMADAVIFLLEFIECLLRFRGLMKEGKRAVLKHEIVVIAQTVRCIVS